MRYRPVGHCLERMIGHGGRPGGRVWRDRRPVARLPRALWPKGRPVPALLRCHLARQITKGNVDTHKLDNDVFEHPENYNTEEKSAVLIDLHGAQKLVVARANAGVWGDDYGKVPIAHRSGA